ncbi:protein ACCUMULATION AND REPLICATION OF CHLOROPLASTS 3 isoform X2 [Coffea eugenioides]|uniref:protein ACCUMULATION AND REPLICATION OF CHLOROPLASTS 3 isoform X2 n=1 Tax=Coffea eugenioides TaxID=49369 RepID=UPI000F60FE3A|nr:protein ACCUMULATION AND REPLICATION OF CHLOROPLASTS 3 isoform X2 [Coffea eugenioides]
MAFHIPKSIPSSPTPCTFPHPSFLPHNLHYSHYYYRTRFTPISRRKLLRPQLHISNSSKSANSISDEDSKNNRQDSVEYVEVFGIGSRKDAILDFCLNSPFLSPALRFWNIVVKDSTKVQLQQRLSNQDINPLVEAPAQLRQCSKAVILVASAAYGTEDTVALEILGTTKSENGLVVGIILRPFSFEGQRRQAEVNHLVGKLQEHANFYIVIDTDALLEKDLVTLDEALKTSNDAVLMAINAITILIAEKNLKLLEVAHNDAKEVKVQELQRIFEACREAKIGFGNGFNIKTSVLKAVFDCPFLGVGVKDSSGTIICILASSGVISNNDAGAIFQSVRLTTECKGEIIMSIIHDSKLESNLIRTTIIAFGCTGHQSTKKMGFLSRLAQQFPFIFNILKNQSPEPQRTTEVYLSEPQHFSGVTFSQEHDYMLDKGSLDDTSDASCGYRREVEPSFNSSDRDSSSLRNYNLSHEQVGVEFADSDSFSLANMPDAEGAPTFREELLIRYRLGADDQKTQEWTQELAGDTETTLTVDSVSVFRLPVGVKHLEQAEEYPAHTKHLKRWTREDSRKAQVDTATSVSRDAMGDRGFEATINFNNFSKTRKGNSTNDSNKPGVLSNRAASMLEAERDLPNKKWNPVLQMKYRGGIYHGRIQGGLPEGKGRLSLGDGSIYEGMWRYGKRSGPGTFYFKNGDIYQGSWRDDVMHGKGWFYFHTGDRWFVNFWKGKANGEGRFYSKLGDVFFGHFKDGWRHGHFLCIGIDGTRSREVWEQGVLGSREQLDSDADVA